jgi:hypothetical protein
MADASDFGKIIGKMIGALAMEVMNSNARESALYEKLVAKNIITKEELEEIISIKPRSSDGLSSQDRLSFQFG